MFKQIVERDDFCLEDLYAAFLLYKLSNTIQFGRKASKPSRGQTRYLFYYVLIELLKECLIQANIPLNESSLTLNVIKVFSDTNLEAVNGIKDAALNVIDDYLTHQNEDSVYSEPKFTGDLNAFMKSDKLGKGKEETPKLENLIYLNKLMMRRSVGGQMTPRELILEIIQN